MGEEREPRGRIGALALGALVALPLVTAVAAAIALAWLGEPPLAAGREVSAAVLDREDRLLRPFTTREGRWRLPVEPEEVDPAYLALLLAHEDKRFHSHWGVDPLAGARALWQLVTNGRVVSGASTLTMQVARLLEPRGHRSLGAKLREALRAVQIERRLSKQEILALYLRLAPYGGNLEGVRAASLAYFGKEPRRLGPHEAALLVALPQAPELRRPDRHPDAARRARDRVLERAATAGLLPAREARAATGLDVPTARKPFPLLAPHVAQAAVAREPERTVHRLTLDRDLQAALERLAAASTRRLGPRHSVAIVAVDHASGEVLAHVGSAAFFNARRAGQIDMGHAVRSPGSALKPFVYGLAFEAGLAHPQTLIEDAPTRFADYAPRNFDEGFRGTVTVREALQLSLNVPAVRLLEAVGPVRLLARLREAGVALALPDDAPPGLAVVLGGAGLSLSDLARLYAAVARGGESLPLRYSREAPAGAPRALMSPAAAWHVADALRGAPPPRNAAPGAIAFKTGTSYGYRDAWAAGFDGTHTVAVWTGRPDGAPSPGLTGLNTAAPILFDAFARIGGTRAPLPAPPEAARIAAAADLPPPLRHFSGTGRGGDAGGAPAPRIAFPREGLRVAVAGDGDGPASVPLKAEGGALPLVWLVNGLPVASAPRQRTLFWRPDGEGFARLTVVDARGRSDSVSFRVDRDP